MNKRMLDRIATWLEAGVPETHGVTEFNMRHFKAPAKSGCGTSCCIAGAVVQFHDGGAFEKRLERLDAIYKNAALQKQAERILCLSSWDAECLFMGCDGRGNACVSLRDITPAHAARCIRKFIETGVVDWTGTRP